MKKKISKQILSLLLSFLMVLSVLITAGTEIVHAADEDVVPDPAIRAYLNEKYFGKAGESLQDPISKAQMETKVNGVLALNSKGIENLEGLQYATKVTRLRLNDNNFKNEDLELIKGLTGLNELSLVGNSLKDISYLKDLSNLKELYLQNNKIANLSPLKILNIPTFKALGQEPEITLNAKTFDNPFINKDETKATITPNANLTVAEDGKLTLVNFDTLDSGEKITAEFSGEGEFNGTATFIIDKPTTPDPEPSEDDVIPDQYFRYAINSKLGNTNNGGQDPISKSQMETLTELDYTLGMFYTISDLTGVNYAINLTNLSLDNNKVSDISPLSGLTKMKELSLQNNKISDASVLATLTGLTYYNLKGQEFDFKANSMIVDNPIKDKDGNVVPIKEISGKVENLSDGKIKIVEFNTLNDGAHYTVNFESTDKYFTGTMKLVIDKSQVVEHNINITNPTGATITTIPANKAAKDVTVAVNVNITDQSKVLDKVLIDGTEIDGTNFKMPDKDVTVTATLRDKPANVHYINITTPEGATITTTPANTATTGENVTVNVSVTDSTKVLDKVLVDGTAIDGTNFKMPDKDVTVTVTLRAKPGQKYTIDFANKPTGIKAWDTDQPYMVEAGTKVKVRVTMYYPEHYTYRHLNVTNLKTNEVTNIVEPRTEVTTPGGKVYEHEFTMPESNVQISIPYVEAKIFIEKVNGKNATVTTNPEGSQRNERPATLIISDPDNKLEKVEITDGSGNEIALNADNTFMMPFKNYVNIKVIFAPDDSETDHKIVIDEISGATLATEPENKAPKGKEVELFIKITDPTKSLDRFIVTDADGNEVAITNDKFTMPDKDVKVSAILKDKTIPITEHKISIDQISGATLATKPQYKAAKGTSVILYAKILDNNKELDRFIVKDTDGNEVVVTDNIFTMPDKGVKVTALLKDKDAPLPQDEYRISVYQGTASQYRAKAGDVITVSTVLPEGKFNGWSGNVDFSNPRQSVTNYVMPARDVSIKANEKLGFKDIYVNSSSPFPSTGVSYKKELSTQVIELVSKFVIGSKEYNKTLGNSASNIKMDVAPFIKNNRTMLSLRFVGEALGYDVSWEKETRTAVLKNKENTIRVQVDSDTFTINGKEFKFDSKPTMKDNRTMLSISNLGFALGLKEGTDIIWEGGTRTVIVKTRVSVPVEKEVPVNSTPTNYRGEYTRRVMDQETPFNQYSVLRNQLKGLVADAKALDLSNASPASAEALKKAIGNAEKIIDNNSSTNNDLKEGISALRIAMNSIKPDTPQDPKAALRLLVQRAEQLQEDKYTPETFGPLKTALNAAKTVVADVNATVDQINTTKTNLQDAIDALVEKSEEESEVRQELRGLVDEAGEIDRNLYTEVSLKKLDEAITKAKESLNDPTQDDDTVDISVEIIKLAIINLVKKDEAVLKQFTVTEPHGLLNSDFAFAYMVGFDDEFTTNLKIFVDGKEIKYGKNPDKPGFYVYRTIFSNKNEIHLTAATFSDEGEFTIKLVADGYATKEFNLEMEKFAPRLDIRYGTIIKGVPVPITWGPGNPTGLEQRYFDNKMVVKINGGKANFSIPSHRQSLTISGNNFKTNGTYKIELEREDFETKEFTLHVSDLEKIDIISTATTAYQLKDEYTVGGGQEGYLQMKFQKFKAYFKDDTFTHLEYTSDFASWGLVVTPNNGYVLQDKDVGDLPVIVSKDGKELGRRIVKVKPRK